MKTNLYTGRDLKAERVRAGMTQDELADRLGVTRSRVSAIEAARWPSPSAAERIIAVIRDEPDGSAPRR